MKGWGSGKRERKAKEREKRIEVKIVVWMNVFYVHSYVCTNQNFKGNNTKEGL